MILMIMMMIIIVINQLHQLGICISYEQVLQLEDWIAKAMFQFPSPNKPGECRLPFTVPPPQVESMFSYLKSTLLSRL